MDALSCLRVLEIIPDGGVAHVEDQGDLEGVQALLAEIVDLLDQRGRRPAMLNDIFRVVKNLVIREAHDLGDFLVPLALFLERSHLAAEMGHDVRRHCSFLWPTAPSRR
jgi:hypothetical protein